MLTRFSTVTCPQCGHSAKPITKQPGSDNVSAALSLTGIVGTAYDAYRLTGAELYCPQCGHQFADSIQAKAKTTARSLFSRAKDFAAKTAAEIQAPVCGACHQRIDDPPPAACPHCGVPLARP
jgi:predicted RNA-binding Zn-ribbon protein involved in translation (DUF1610 family)